MTTPADAPVGWYRQAEQRLADGMARRLLASATARARTSTRSSAGSRLLMWVVVTPVHVVLWAAALGGVWLVLRGHGGPLRLLGVLLLLVAFATWPRPGKLPNGSGTLTRDAAPTLFSLLDDVAAVCGTRTPTTVLVLRDFNAYVTRVGWRRTRVLAIGAPLWVASPRQARVALLGHELGHFAHGDLTDGWWVWAAQRSLLHWLDIVGGPRHVLYADTAFVVKYLMLPFRAAVLAYLWLIRTVNGPDSQRREYLADADAARAAGTPDAVRLLEVLFLEPLVSTAMTRAAVRPDRPDLWETVRDDVRGLGEDDFRRRREGVVAERSRIDDSHPATVLRLSLVETLPPSSAAVVLDAGRDAAIERELARPFAVAATQAAERIRYRR